MPRIERPTFRRALLLGGALVLATLSCGREVTGPPGTKLMRGFSFDARFDTPGLANGVAGTIVSFTRVRVVLENALGEVVVDEVVDFPSTAEEVEVALDVPISTDAPPSGETMSLALAFINAQNDTVFRGGPLAVPVVPTIPGQQPPPPPVVPVTYVGVGANAASVVITPPSASVLAGDAFAFTGVAFDAQGAPIANTPIAWRSESPTRATITAPGAGAGVSLPSRGPAMIIAQLLGPNAPADTVMLDVLPRAQSLAIVSGNNQTASFGTPLAQPLVVRVNATDGLGMQGVTVNFAAAAGSGSVSAPSVVTDANGLAQVSWTAGDALGAQTVTATAAGLTGSPSTFTALAPLTVLLHHFPMNGDLADVAGGQNGTLVGGASVADGALTLDGSSGYAQMPTFLIPTQGSYSVSLFVRNRTSLSFWAEYISQGTLGDAFYIGHDPNGFIRAGDWWLNTTFPTPAIDGLYHHYVVTVDSAANTSRFYADGVLRGTLPQRITSSGLGTATRLGRQHSGNLEYLDGEIDEVRIVRGVLTAAQVAALHTAGVTAPGRLVYGTQPTNVVAGAAIAPAVVVRAEDGLGRLKTDFTGAVTIALSANPGGATLGGTLTVNAVAGIATFPNLTLGALASGYQLTATATGLLAAASTPFNVVAGAATQLTFTQQPTNAAPNTALAPPVVVTARDGQGNVATTFTGSVTLGFGTNPSGAVFGGTVTVNAVAGVATFPDVRVSLAGVGYTLTAAATGLTGATSSAFTINDNTATRLEITQQGSTVSAGIFMTPELVVTARTASNAVATDFTGDVTVSLLSGPGTLAGVLTATAVAGVATFPSVTFRIVSAGSTLLVSAPGLVPDTSAAITVTPGLTYTLAFVQEPSATLAGAVIAPAVVVRATDTFGNTTPSYVDPINITFGTNPTGATLGGMVPVVPVNGIATFPNLTVSAAGSGYRLQANAPGLASGYSAFFNVTAGAQVNVWTNAAGGNWSVPTNWSLGRTPVATDTVMILTDGTYSVTMDVNDTVSVLLVGGGTGVQTLAVGARSLRVESVATIQPSGVLSVGIGGTLTGPATVVNNGQMSVQGATVTTALTNTGLLVSAGGTSTLSGALSTAPGSTLRLLGSVSNSTLNVSSGFTNNGTVEFTTQGGGYNVQLTAPALINASTGVINVLAGSGGLRTLAAPLDNAGTINLPYQLALNVASAAHVNSGTINLSTGNLAITQSGTAPSFTNTGTIALNAGRTLAFSGGQIDLTAGLVSGFGGTLTTTGTPTVRFLTSTVQPRVALGVGAILPDPFVIPAGDSLRLVGGVFAPPTLTNDGLLLLEGDPILTTAFTTGAGSTLRVRGSTAGGSPTATFTNGFTNSAAIELTAIEGGYTVNLTVTGTLVNAPTGTITSITGSGGSRALNTQLDNQGTLSTPYPLSIGRASAAHLNSGTINVTGGNLTVTQTGTGPSFTNTGTVAVSASRVFAINGGTADLSAGLVSGFSGTFSTTGTTTVRFLTTTVQPRITLGAGAVMPDPFVVPAGDSLRILGGVFTPPTLTNDGLLLLEGDPVITTAFTTGTGSVVRVRGSVTGGSPTATFANGFTNTAAIELTAIDGGYTVVLGVTTGTLVNAPSGTITSVAGSGGSRTLAAQLDNQGTVQVPFLLALARASAAHVNSGTINATTGNLSITQTGTTPSFTNTGTVALTAGRTMSVAGGLLDLSSGLVSGFGSFLATTGTATVRFVTTTVQPRITLGAGAIMPDPFVVPAGDSLRILGGVFTPPTLTNDGLLLLEGDPVITTAFTTGTGSTLRVRGSATGGSPTATFANGFTNTSAIELTAIDGGYTVVLGVTSGTLVNAPSGTITSVAGSGGSRTLAAQLDNQGTIDVPFLLTLARASAAHVNSGTINSTTGNLSIAQSGTTPSFTNTGTVALTTGRTMTVSGGLLDLTSGLVSGFGSFLTTTGAATVRFVTTTVQPRITLGAGAIVPDPFVVPAGDSLRILGGTFTPPTLVNNGLLLLEGDPVITTAFTTGTGSTLRVRGSGTGGSPTATFTNGFTNTSAIELTAIDGGYTVVFGVTNGTLVNAPSGSITSVTGSGGSRTLAAQLDNQGTLDLPFPLALNRASAAHVNSGTINSTAGNLSIAQSGTTPSFTNTGTVALTAGRTLTVSGGLLDLSAGLVSGFGSFLTTTGAATVRFVTTTVQPRITLGAGAIVPDPFVVPAGDSLRILGGTFAPPTLTNNGLLLLEGDPVITTAFTTGTGSTLRVRGSGTGGSPTATFANGFTNTAAIELTTIDGGYTVVLGVTNGTLVNAPSGTITSVPGAGGSRTLAAQLDNQGTVQVPFLLSLARASAAHVNSGTINATTGNLSITQTGTTPSFTNTGTVALTAGRTMTVAGGLLDLSSGLVSGFGSFLTTSGTATVRFLTSTVQPRVTFGAGAVMPDPFVVPAGDSLRLLGGTFSPPTLTNNGLLLLEGDPVITTAFTTGAGSTLRVRGSGTGGSPTATFANGFTNTAAIDLTTIDGGYTVVFGVTNGTLVNAPGGTIAITTGAGGSRTIAAQLDNQGTLTASMGFALARASAAHVNSGAITPASSFTVTQTGVTPSFTNQPGGVIALATNQSMVVSGGTADFRTGLLSGYNSTLQTTGTATVRFLPANVQPRINFTAATTVPDAMTIGATDSVRVLDGTFAPASLVNQGTLVLEGGAVMTTPAFTTVAGSAIRVRANSTSGGTSATITNGFTNEGTLSLTAADAGYVVSLAIPNGTLVNAPGGTITSLAGTGGSRTLTAQFENQGTMNLAFALAVNRASAAHLNSGAINLTGGDLTVTQSGTTPSFTNTGVITAATGRTMSVNGGTLQLTGGDFNGPAATLATNATTVNFDLASVESRLVLTNSTVPGTFTIPAGDTLRLVGGSPTMTIVNDGMLRIQDNVTLNGTLTSGAGSIVEILASSEYGAVATTFANAFTNNGIFRLRTLDAGYVFNVTFSAGTFVNAAGGTVSFEGLNDRTLTAPAFTNLGIWDVAASGVVNGPFAQSGSLTIAAARTMTLSSLLTLTAGSNTTVNGTLVKNGGCTNLGGSIGGGGTGATCP